MLTLYRIHYCKPNGHGGFINARPDKASVFRVFEIRPRGIARHVKDFFPLSEANEWIETQQRKEFSDLSP